MKRSASVSCLPETEIRQISFYIWCFFFLFHEVAANVKGNRRLKELLIPSYTGLWKSSWLLPFTFFFFQMMPSFLSSQEEHWAVKPIWHGGKSTQCGKRLGMETLLFIYLFVLSSSSYIFILIHLELHHMVKKRRMKIFSIEQHFTKKKKNPPKLGLYLVFEILSFPTNMVSD